MPNSTSCLCSQSTPRTCKPSRASVRLSTLLVSSRPRRTSSTRRCAATCSCSNSNVIELRAANQDDVMSLFGPLDHSIHSPAASSLADSAEGTDPTPHAAVTSSSKLKSSISAVSSARHLWLLCTASSNYSSLLGPLPGSRTKLPETRHHRSLLGKSNTRLCLGVACCRDCTTWTLDFRPR